jgi:hypothetical protein
MESAVRSDPAAVMSELPGAEPLETRAADEVAAAESVGAFTETPWLLIAGAVGLAASLLAAESVRRRRRT